MNVAKIIASAAIMVLSIMPAYAQNTMAISQGSAEAITTKQAIGSVFVAKPSVADYQIIDHTKVIVFGRSLGETTLMAFSEGGQTLFSKQVVVSKNLTMLKQQVAASFPDSQVQIDALGNSVLLSGMVSSEEVRDDIEALVGTLLQRKRTIAEVQWNNDQFSSQVIDQLTSTEFEGIINNLKVSETRQINVKLSIAEVSHSLMENLGIQTGTKGRNTGVFTANEWQLPTSSDLVSTITAINDKSIGQILAEPNLSVISGETASFLVGGEMPITTVIDDTVNITYKEFGVKLDVAAKVFRDDRIRLSLSPEVSSIDMQFADSLYNVPAFRTRRARTTVELSDGQSFILGGLLNSEERELLRKIPFIGDIPILGALFRYTETERNDSELLIVATVNLVAPIAPAQVALPTYQRTTTLSRFFAVPDDPENLDGSASARQFLSHGGFQK